MQTKLYIFIIIFYFSCFTDFYRKGRKGFTRRTQVVFRFIGFILFKPYSANQ